MHCLFLKYLLVSNSLIGSRGAKMNILKLGALEVLETQIRVSFLNHRFLAFHLGKCQNPTSALEFPQDDDNIQPSPHPPPTTTTFLLHHLQHLAADVFSRTFLYEDEWHMGTSLSDTYHPQSILLPILPDSFGDSRKLV